MNYKHAKASEKGIWYWDISHDDAWHPTAKVAALQMQEAWVRGLEK